jgi:hypothetical protein
MEISDLDSGPLLLYFKNLVPYLAELERLEPVKPIRHVVLPTSTPIPTTVRIPSESLNNTVLTVNSSVSSVETNSSVNEPETKYGTGTIIFLGCAGVVSVVLLVVIVVFGRRHFKCRSYSPASTQES